MQFWETRFLLPRSLLRRKMAIPTSSTSRLAGKKWAAKEKATKGWGNIWAYLHSQLNAKKFRGGEKKGLASGKTNIAGWKFPHFFNRKYEETEEIDTSRVCTIIYFGNKYINPLGPSKSQLSWRFFLCFLFLHRWIRWVRANSAVQWAEARGLAEHSWKEQTPKKVAPQQAATITNPGNPMASTIHGSFGVCNVQPLQVLSRGPQLQV